MLDIFFEITLLNSSMSISCGASISSDLNIAMFQSDQNIVHHGSDVHGAPT